MTRAVRELAVGGELVLFDPSAGRAHRLNPSAAAIWHQCQVSTDPTAIADALAPIYGLDAGVLLPDVQATCARFEAAGLFDDDHDRPRSTPLPIPSGPNRSARSPLVGRFRAFEFRFAVHTDDRELARTVADELAALRDDADGTVDEVYEIDGHFTVRIGGEPARTLDDRDAALTFLYWLVHRRAIDSTSRLVRLHASAIQSGDAVVALPAPPESGKSTLATALVAAGYGYVTDEAVAFDPVTLEVAKLPLPITLDAGSWPLFPQLGDRQATRALDPRRVDERALRHHDRPARLALCVFHRYQPGADTLVERLDEAGAVVHLLENAFGLERAGDAIFDGLCRVAREVPCLRLVHGDLDAAVAAVVGAVEEVQARSR